MDVAQPRADLNVLVVNAGSSSLKLTLLGDGDETIAERELAAPGERVDGAELRDALSGALRARADVVGHRIVHGGERFTSAVELDAEVEAQLRALSDLAPLHQRKSLAALDAVGTELGHLPAVACFDTAFHSGMPEAARTYPLPPAWRERWAIRRYGFHGLSHAWVARHAPALLARTGGGEGPPLRIVSCHLGAGASLCAIEDGRSIDTTMGFTPLEGLAMATRSGSVDPGLLLWLIEHASLEGREIEHALEHESGMLALAGTQDMKEVVNGAEAGERAATLALEVYLHRLCGGIASMAASLEGIDVLAFTGGVGEHAPTVRRLAAERLRFLGVGVDGERNERGGEGDVSAADATVRTLVIEAREDLTIAHEVRALLSG